MSDHSFYSLEQGGSKTMNHIHTLFSILTNLNCQIIVNSWEFYLDYSWMYDFVSSFSAGSLYETAFVCV